MQIRAIKEEDLDKLGQVYVESFKGVDPTEKWTNQRATQLLRFIFTTQPNLSFLIEENGKIGGGVLGMIKPWWDGNHLVETELFLAPSFQKRNIGTKLFYHYLETAYQLYEVTEMETLTFKNIEFPLSWYHSLGFVAKDDWQVMFGDIRSVIQKLQINLKV